jgi:RNase P protein component
MAKFGAKISMGNDLLIIARSALLTVSPVDLDQAFEQLLVKARLLNKND